MKRLTGMIALGLAAGGLAACRANEQVPEATAQPPIAVTIATVAAVDGYEPLEAGGVVSAPESATLSSRIVATIAGVRVNAGDRVRAGDILVTLDAADVVAQTGQARASALAAEKSLTQARTEQQAAEAEHQLAAAWRKRITTLHARNSATDQERDEADARLAAARARLARAQAGIDGADAQLAAARAGIAVATATESFATVRAPFAGLIIERLTDPGNLAAPGAPLLRVESDGARQVVVRVDEARAAYVRPGDRVAVLFEAGDELPANHHELEGVITEVTRAVAADRRAFTVKVTLPAAVTLRSGSFARVVFRGAPRRALLAPADAVRRQGQVVTVFVVHDGVAQLRLVQAGPIGPTGVEVLAGLDAGELIVTSPPPGLRDGSRVTTSRVGTSSGGPQ